MVDISNIKQECIVEQDFVFYLSPKFQPKIIGYCLVPKVISLRKYVKTPKIFSKPFIYFISDCSTCCRLVFFIWYLSPLVQAVGVTHIFLMMLAIDVILWDQVWVYWSIKKAKKTLKFDLSVIILIQIAALCYGYLALNKVAQHGYIHVDCFELVRKIDLILEILTKYNLNFQQVSWTGPQFCCSEISR